jgi:hypothetical protein
MDNLNNYHHDTVNQAFMARFNLPMQFINNDAITNT